ncbi:MULTISPECIES: SGNH/GDSL hydrolase family protein [Actinosynnema]|uniref:SGNH/GDSL hydrolase family protein n=1 Tax=Actinosynnema TaxID=40566 RepID=UPI0020A2DD6F|nr:SGNH/GDSL hydrolase family protein [Actinosynnema pretiosum]MCP2093024.1 Lysophospholipase L1 [Actinosynnema pretiosum]
MGARAVRAAAGAGLAAALVVGVVAAGAWADLDGARADWAGAWAASPVVGGRNPHNDCPSGEGLTDRTVRNVVFASAGGDLVRIRLGNAFGTTPLAVDRASVAVRGSGAAPAPDTTRALTFDGARSARVPAGGELVSDPVDLDVAALSTLLVSVHFPGPTGPLTNHPFTAQDNYLATGDRTDDRTGEGFAATPCWMGVSAVDVAERGEPSAGAIVVFGDSITDTAASTDNTNRRWPDFLARRLAKRGGRTPSVVNAGLGGNCLVADRPDEPHYGVAGTTRFARDALGQTGVRTVIVLSGVNDLSFSATADELIAGYRDLIAQAHRKDVRIVGGTIMPFKTSFVWTPEREATWRTVNTWIRTSGEFDAVIDFATAMAAPDDDAVLAPAYDRGDGLHPNDAGTEAMADAVDLRLL